MNGFPGTKSMGLEQPPHKSANKLGRLKHGPCKEALPSNRAALEPLSIRTALHAASIAFRKFHCWNCLQTMHDAVSARCRAYESTTISVPIFAQFISLESQCSGRQADPCVRKRTCRPSTCEPFQVCSACDRL